MLKLKIDVPDGLLQELHARLSLISENALPATSSAVRAGALIARETWRGFATGGALPGVTEKLKRPQGGYARSIRSRQTGAFEYEIYSDSKVAAWIENGTSDIDDMRKTHLNGPKARMSAAGYPYLIVPFQWGTGNGSIRSGPKNIVPKSLVAAMRNTNFKSSKVTGKYLESNNHGNKVSRYTYSWGNRVHSDGNSDGMVRFDQSGGSNKRYGGYFTFRIISANPKSSGGWSRKGMPARHVTRAVSEAVRNDINKLVESGIREDLGL